MFFGVPTLYAAMLAHPDAPRSLGAVRLCVSAGEALPAALFERWATRFGVEILDGLGQHRDAAHLPVESAGAARAGSSGVPVPGYEVRIVDGDGRDVEDGEIGTLLAGGRSAARAYHARPEETARTMFAPGWLRTGDSYRRDADGFHWHVGRSDDLMKVSGQYVSPVEVEGLLAAHPAVLEAAVVGQSDEHGLTKPRAFVVLAPGVSPSEGLARELQEHREGKGRAAQVSSARGFRGRAAEDRHRQDPAPPAAREAVVSAAGDGVPRELETCPEQLPPLAALDRRRGGAPRARGRRGWRALRRRGPEAQQLRPGRGPRAARRSHSPALRAPRGALRGARERVARRVLRGREHRHARALFAPAEGELLQAHQRDAARAGGRRRAPASAGSRRSRERRAAAATSSRSPASGSCSSTTGARR